MVERIIAIESNGDPDAKNKRSSATGAGQFLDDTWLEAVRRHRRDLIQGRSNQEILKLRRDTELTREIVARLIEQYAAILSKRGVPVTPGTLYLSYFAGPAGAVALLSSAEDADAASRMAGPRRAASMCDGVEKTKADFPGDFRNSLLERRGWNVGRMWWEQ